MFGETFFGSVSLKRGGVSKKLSNSTFRLYIERGINCKELFPPPHNEPYECIIPVPIGWLPPESNDNFVTLNLSANPILNEIYERELYISKGEYQLLTFNPTMALRENSRFITIMRGEQFLRYFALFISKTIPELKLMDQKKNPLK